MSSPRRLIPLFAVALAFGAALARAQPDAPIRVEYAAPARCPAADAFVEALVARAPRARIVGGQERARTLAVRVSSRGRALVGRVTVRELDGRESERAVAGEDCADVVSALALIAAVAVDPTAAARAPSSDAGATSATEADAGSGASAPASTQASGAAASAAGDAGASDASADGAPGARPARATPAEPAREGPDAARAEEDGAPRDTYAGAAALDREPHAVRIEAGVHAAVGVGALPDTAFTVPVFLEVGAPEQRVFAPSLRARFERAGGSVTAQPAGGDFTWTAGSLDACPIVLPSRGRVRATPCVRAEGGLLEGTGVGVQPSRSSARPWFSIGAVARVRWTVVGPLVVELEGAVMVPTVRDRFFVEPSATVFQPPAVGFGGAAGLGVNIW